MVQDGTLLALTAAGVLALGATVRRGSRATDWRGKFKVEHPSFHYAEQLELYDNDGIFVARYNRPKKYSHDHYEKMVAWLDRRRPQRGYFLRTLRRNNRTDAELTETGWFQHDGPESPWSDGFLDPENGYQVILRPTLAGGRVFYEEKPDSPRRRRDRRRR